MNAPALQILAFSPPSVNGRAVRVHIATEKGQGDLTGSRELMRSLAAALLAACDGLSVAVAEATPHIERRGWAGGRHCSPERLAAYERIRTRVRDGATWKAAAEAEGISVKAAYAFFHNQRLRARAASQPAALSPSR